MANRSTLNIPALPNIPVSNAFAILTEEQINTEPVLYIEQCYICCKDIQQDHIVCETCQGICHHDCVVFNTDNITASCLACVGENQQLNLAGEQSVDSNPQVQGNQLVSTDTGEIAIQDEKRALLKGLNEKDKEIRKLQNDLKLKDKELSEAYKHKPKTDIYIKKHEAKCEEQERTIKTLLNKIEFLENKVESLEKTAKYSNHPTQSNGTSENNELAASIHSQVTSLVLKKVSQELESFGSQWLASSNTANKSSTQTQPTTTSIEKQQTAQETIPNQKLNENTVYSNVMKNANTTGQRDGRTHTGVPQSTGSVTKGEGDVILPEGFVAFPRNQLHAVMQGRPILKSRSYKPPTNTQYNTNSNKSNSRLTLSKTVQHNINNYGNIITEPQNRTVKVDKVIHQDIKLKSSNTDPDIETIEPSNTDKSEQPDSQPAELSDANKTIVSETIDLTKGQAIDKNHFLAERQDFNQRR